MSSTGWEEDDNLLDEMLNNNDNISPLYATSSNVPVVAYGENEDDGHTNEDAWNFESEDLFDEYDDEPNGEKQQQREENVSDKTSNKDFNFHGDQVCNGLNIDVKGKLMSSEDDSNNLNCSTIFHEGCQQIRQSCEDGHETEVKLILHNSEGNSSIEINNDSYSGNALKATGNDSWNLDEDNEIFNEESNSKFDNNHYRSEETVQNPVLSLPSLNVQNPLLLSEVSTVNFGQQEINHKLQSVKSCSPDVVNNCTFHSQPASEDSKYLQKIESEGSVNSGDGWSDDEKFFDDDEMGPSHETLDLSQPSKEFSFLKPPTFLPFTCHKPDGGFFQEHQPQYRMSGITDPIQRQIFHMLSVYVSTIKSYDFLSHLNQKLNSRTNKFLVRNNTPTTASDLRTYYATRPGLRKYTLGVELNRMDYQLILENGKQTDDKDVIRSYFGVDNDGEPRGSRGTEEVISIEELLIRSANQSLLADLLQALTGPEEDILNDYIEDDFFNLEDKERQDSVNLNMGLILSGPMLCMSSVAETCQFIVDLQCHKVEAVCVLAIGVPFHDNLNRISDLASEKDCITPVESGRLILARAEVSINFYPGCDEGSSPIVQFAVQSIKPSLISPKSSSILHCAAISLSRDHVNPCSQGSSDINERTADVRDLFLLNHHLLSDSHLLVVSDHLVRLRGAAEASSSGFQSALRQLDGVTNVSGKFKFLKNTTINAAGAIGQGGRPTSGFAGFLSLPSAEEIEAAEREAMGAFSFIPSTNPYSKPEISNMGYSRVVDPDEQRPSEQAALPIGGQVRQEASRPRPLIGGIFMSGLSRLAAVATQPDDDQSRESLAKCTGTGLTPSSSPPSASVFPARDNHATSFNGRDTNQTALISNIVSSSSSYKKWDTVMGGEISTQCISASQDSNVRPRLQTQEIEKPFFAEAVLAKESADDSFKNNDIEGKLLCDIHDSLEKVDADYGWPEEELDLQDESSHFESWNEQKLSKETTEVGSKCNTPGSFELKADNSINTDGMCAIQSSSDECMDYVMPEVEQVYTIKNQVDKTDKILSSSPSASYHCTNEKNDRQLSATFAEEFVIVFKEKIESELQEMRETGRMKRWKPISEDPVLRQRLMEVMINQLDSSGDCY